jgi:putative alpha-1,2-mannosidase
VSIFTPSFQNRLNHWNSRRREFSKQKNSAQGKNVKTFVEYSTTKDEEILVKVGISHTSIEGAEKNVKAEIKGWNFKEVVKQADNAWHKELSSIKVKSKDESKLRVFIQRCIMRY